MGVLDLVPDLHEIGFLLRQNELPFLSFDIFQEDLDVLADFELVGVGELGKGYRSFRLEPDIDDDLSVFNRDNNTGNNLAFHDILQGLVVHLEHLLVFFEFLLIQILFIHPLGEPVRALWRNVFRLDSSLRCDSSLRFLGSFRFYGGFHFDNSLRCDGSIRFHVGFRCGSLPFHVGFRYGSSFRIRYNFRFRSRFRFNCCFRVLYGWFRGYLFSRLRGAGG